MFTLPWYSILLLTIPQVFLSILIGFQLFNRHLDFRKCLAAACLVGIVTYFLRGTFVTPGLHSILIILVMALSITLINRGNILYNFFAAILGAMIMGVIEGIWVPIFFSLTSTSVVDLSLNPWLNIGCFAPILLVAIILYIIIRRKNFYIYNLGEKDNYI